MTGNGTLTVKSPAGVVWSNNVVQANAWLALQKSDGHLVEYGPNGYAWANGVHDFPNASSAYLVMQDDGNAVVYSPGRAGPRARTGAEGRRALDGPSASLSALRA